MKKKLTIVLIIFLIILLIFSINIFVYLIYQQNNFKKISSCADFPSKSGCYISMFDLLIPKMLVYSVKTDGDNSNIILEKSFSRIFPKFLLDKTDVFLGWGISRNIELEQNYSLYYDKPSYGFDCGVQSININSEKCKFQSECIGGDKYIKTNLGQVSSKKIHNFEDKIKELNLEDKKIFVKLSFFIDGEYEVLEDILKHSNQITGISLAFQINNSKNIQTALKMLEMLNKDFVLVSRNASTLHENDPDKFGTFINSSTYKGYLGHNLFFLVFANKNLLNDYSISLNQNDSLIYNPKNTIKVLYEKKKLKTFQPKDFKELNISKGQIKYRVVFVEKLKEAGIIKTK